MEKGIKCGYVISEVNKEPTLNQPHNVTLKKIQRSSLPIFTVGWKEQLSVGIEVDKCVWPRCRELAAPADVAGPPYRTRSRLLMHRSSSRPRASEAQAGAPRRQRKSTRHTKCR